jgi:hypothetical protein
MTAIPTASSPCRRHPCSREHADLVRMFRSIALDWEMAAERVTGGYDREMALYLEGHPRPTLKGFLVACRRPREDEDRSEGRAA